MKLLEIASSRQGRENWKCDESWKGGKKASNENSIGKSVVKWASGWMKAVVRQKPSWTLKVTSNCSSKILRGDWWRCHSEAELLDELEPWHYHAMLVCWHTSSSSESNSVVILIKLSHVSGKAAKGTIFRVKSSMKMSETLVRHTQVLAHVVWWMEQCAPWMLHQA